jgi:hypothetical protein
MWCSLFSYHYHHTPVIFADARLALFQSACHSGESYDTSSLKRRENRGFRRNLVPYWSPRDRVAPEYMVSLYGILSLRSSPSPYCLLSMLRKFWIERMVRLLEEMDLVNLNGACLTFSTWLVYKRQPYVRTASPLLLTLCRGMYSLQDTKDI